MTSNDAVTFFNMLIQVICALAGIALVCSGFDQSTNPGLPVAGAIIIFTIVYAEINSRK